MDEEGSGFDVLDNAFNAKKRKREKPNRKWSDHEVLQIVEFLMEHRPLEVPTAQMYYKKLIEDTGVEADWNLVRWKVRNLRTTYRKVAEWQKRTGAGILETDEGVRSVEQKLYEMCPHFKKLEEVFGEKDAVSDMIIYETLIEDENSDQNGFYVMTSTPKNSSFTEHEVSAILESEVTISEERKNAKQPVSKTQAKYLSDKMKKSAPKAAISRLSDLQSERNTVQLKKLEFEKEKFKEEREFQERKLELEKERQKKVLELDEARLKFEQENKLEELRLRAAEMEMKERLARYELELKFKVKYAPKYKQFH